MSRETCYRCFRPARVCWCGELVPMATRTRFVLLMHPKEFKREKANTGRITHLCLANSEIIVDASLEENVILRERLADPTYHSALLYPGEAACDLSAEQPLPAALTARPLQLFILDATWSAARKMLRLSPVLQALPRLMFRATAPSRYRIKQQPQDGCLSTLESVHELLLVLARRGLDHYALPTQLLTAFARMQDFQMECAANPELGGYRRAPYKETGARKELVGQSARRRRYLRVD
ncbi:MAG: DTW domain-containing protein [Opitutaceae bacterium]|nr:DTW domain-containing protein [Opitutaceae bacterium]